MYTNQRRGERSVCVFTFLVYVAVVTATSTRKWDTDAVALTVVPEGILSHRAIHQAIHEYNSLPLISPRLMVMPPSPLLQRGAELSDGMFVDGINSVKLRRIGTPAVTRLKVDETVYPPLIQEVDILIDPDWIQTEDMLHIILLHEFGHVMGLTHPTEAKDTVMGYHVEINEIGEPKQEEIWLQLTQTDITNIYLQNMMWAKERKRDALLGELTELLVHEPLIPHTLQEQRVQAICYR